VFGGDYARLDLRVFNMGFRVKEEVEVKSKGEGKAKSYWLNDWGGRQENSLKTVC